MEHNYKKLGSIELLVYLNECIAFKEHYKGIGSRKFSYFKLYLYIVLSVIIAIGSLFGGYLLNLSYGAEVAIFFSINGLFLLFDLISNHDSYHKTFKDFSIFGRFFEFVKFTYFAIAITLFMWAAICDEYLYLLNIEYGDYVFYIFVILYIITFYFFIRDLDIVFKKFDKVYTTLNEIELNYSKVENVIFSNIDEQYLNKYAKKLKLNYLVNRYKDKFYIEDVKTPVYCDFFLNSSRYSSNMCSAREYEENIAFKEIKKQKRKQKLNQKG